MDQIIGADDSMYAQKKGNSFIQLQFFILKKPLQSACDF